MKLWEYDLRHIGDLCNLIRSSHGVIPTEIADYVDVEPSTITRFERSGKTTLKTFNGYVRALHANIPAPRRLSPQQERFLSALYDPSLAKKPEKWGCELAAIDLEDIKREPVPKKLAELVDELRREDRPAFIMDSLWFIHAVNEPLLRLFGIEPDSEYLERWEAWHVLATKFNADSPVRKAHTNTDEYFPPAIGSFFNYQIFNQSLFTWQMRKLIQNLHELSEQNNYKFTTWWLNTISFTLDFELKSLTRTILHQGQRIQTESVERVAQEVRMSPEHTVIYSLGVWNPISSDAKVAFEAIRPSPETRTIYYAVDYARKANVPFHVNDWPEVQMEIQEWIKQGKC